MRGECLIMGALATDIGFKCLGGGIVAFLRRRLASLELLIRFSELISVVQWPPFAALFFGGVAAPLTWSSQKGVPFFPGSLNN